MAKRKPKVNVFGTPKEDAKPKEIPQENKSESKLIPLGNRKAHGYRSEKRYIKTVSELANMIPEMSRSDIINEALREYLESLPSNMRAELDRRVNSQF